MSDDSGTPTVIWFKVDTHILSDLNSMLSQRDTFSKDIRLNVYEIPLRWIWMKICILMYFEVLKNVKIK